MTPEAADLIEIDPRILHGQAHIRGTRIPVSVVLDSIAAGLSEADVLEEFPTLTVERIRAAARFSSD
jgi:uncharacterized protein (DUF433 family)